MAAATDPGIYRETLVFLGTAGVIIPLMARLRISPVLGFLVAGLVLAPIVSAVCMMAGLGSA